jgi:hypothetical protein
MSASTELLLLTLEHLDTQLTEMQMDTSSFGAANASCVYGVLQLLFDELN